MLEALRENTYRFLSTMGERKFEEYNTQSLIPTLGISSLSEVWNHYRASNLYPETVILDLDGVLLPTIGELLLGLKHSINPVLSEIFYFSKIGRSAEEVILLTSRYPLPFRMNQRFSIFPFIHEQDLADLARLTNKTIDQDFFYYRKLLKNHSDLINRLGDHLSSRKDDLAVVHYIGSNPTDWQYANQLGVDLFFSTKHRFI